jgi:hypothetical protein
MIMGWIRSMLGPLAVIMDFFSAHPEILTAILAVWMLIYAIGRIQLALIQQKTARLVVELSRSLVAANPQVSLADLREQLLPPWLEELKTWKYLFIPHKYDFWPVPASVKNVQIKFPMPPDWLNRVLKTNGILLQGAPPAASIRPVK